MILFQKTADEKTKFEFEQIDENHACLTLQEINFLLLEFERFDFLRRKHYSCNFLCTFEIPLCKSAHRRFAKFCHKDKLKFQARQHH